MGRFNKLIATKWSEWELHTHVYPCLPVVVVWGQWVLILSFCLPVTSTSVATTGSRSTSWARSCLTFSRWGRSLAWCSAASPTSWSVAAPFCFDECFVRSRLTELKGVCVWAGLKPTADAFFLFMFSVILVSYTATSMALAISADQTVVAIANIFMTITCVFMMVPELQLCSLWM